MDLRTASAPMALLLMLDAASLHARDAGEVLPSVHARAKYQELARPAAVPPDNELEAAGATIGRIYIETDNVFDTADSQENTALPRLANRLHIPTRSGTVESRLLFRAGDLYSARALEESERLLRDTRYLYDARVRPIAYRDGKVDIEVRTRDVWTLNPGLSFGRRGGASTSGVELEELNLLGTGTQLSLGFKSGIDRDSVTLLFRDRQLFGSWWDLSLQGSDNSDGQAHALQFERPFYALDARWAAGVTLQDEDRIDSQYDLGEITNQFRTRQKLATVYGGWSAGLHDGWVRRWTAGITMDDSQFEAAPDALFASVVPPDRKLVYPWLGFEWLQDRFLKTRNRDQIEKTEDFCLGWRFNAQLGFSTAALGADRAALLLSTGLAKGFELTERQTLLTTAELSVRLENGEVANALASVSSRYYLRQSARRLLFVGLRAEASSGLDADRQLLLGGDNGLRGYPLRYQGGEGQWLFTAEQRWFSDWYPFRLFNVGGAAFFDMGRTWGDSRYGTASQGMLKDVGVGLRLGSSRSALGNVIHIDVAMPLDGGSSIDKLQFLVETRRTF